MTEEMKELKKLLKENGLFYYTKLAEGVVFDEYIAKEIGESIEKNEEAILLPNNSNNILTLSELFKTL